MLLVLGPKLAKEYINSLTCTCTVCSLIVALGASITRLLLSSMWGCPYPTLRLGNIMAPTKKGFAFYRYWGSGIRVLMTAVEAFRHSVCRRDEELQMVTGNFACAACTLHKRYQDLKGWTPFLLHWNPVLPQRIP